MSSDLLDLRGVGSIADSAGKLAFVRDGSRVICRSEDQAELIRRAAARMNRQLVVEVAPLEEIDA